MSHPKRQHFVPRAYIARFSSDDRVVVRRRDGKLFQTNAVNVAVECGFYDITDSSGQRSSSVETMLADLDGDAISAMQWIDKAGLPPPPQSRERQTLANFLAVQSTRTPEQRERVLFPSRVADYANGRAITKELVAEYLEREHLRMRPTENEAGSAYDFVRVALEDPGAYSVEFAVRMMLHSAIAIAPILLRMNWTLEVDRKEQLLTSDTPLVIWRTPSPRDMYEGVGITNADELRFPLDPGQQLVLTKRSRTPTARITAQRARACNDDSASACHRFVIGRPNQMSLVRAVALAKHRPVLRFHTGPLFTVSEGGTRKREGEILHIWVPRRS